MISPNNLIRNLHFGVDGRTEPYRVEGWSHSEREHAWSLVPGCRLSIPLDQPTRNLAVLLDISPAISPPDRPFRRLEVMVNGQKRLHAEIDKRVVLFVTVGKLPDRAPIELQFEFDEQVEGIGKETRPLAFAFYSVKVIDRDPEPIYEPVSYANEMPGASVAELTQQIETMCDAPISDFLTRFESLGHSCDFGIFQRQLGAEPLGLLRFAGISTYRLIAGLFERFEALAKRGTIEAIVMPEWNNEYMMFDHSYGITSHSFLTPAQAAPEQLIAREERRLPFLRRLFLETLDAGEKIFVIRRPDEIHLSEVEAVAAVLRLTSDSILLWACTGTR